jgi:hypothetical protein
MEEAVAKIPFEELVTTLQDDRVVNLMTTFIARVYFLSTPGLVESPECDIPIAIFKPRTFMAAYLIKYHPDRVFGGQARSAQQHDLQEAASNLLVVFEGVRCELIATTEDGKEASANMLAFPLVTTRYMEAFDVWRAWDMIQ